jgi:DNA-binding NtrC family response regulator
MYGVPTHQNRIDEMLHPNWHILVVEDDVDAQDVVARILRHHGIGLEQAFTADEALDHLSAAPGTFTGVIIDLYLPNAHDGWRLFEKIRARWPGLPCVAITAHDSPEVAVRALDEGFAAYFAKPIEAGKFVKALERLWGSS